MPDQFAKVIAAFSKQKDVVVEPGWGEGNFVLKVRSKIFAIVSSERFVAKLPKKRVDEIVDAGAGTRFDPRKNGRVMKEWVVVPDQRTWLPLVREAYRFVDAAVAPARRARPQRR